MKIGKKNQINAKVAERERTLDSVRREFLYFESCPFHGGPDTAPDTVALLDQLWAEQEAKGARPRPSRETCSFCSPRQVAFQDRMREVLRSAYGAVHGKSTSLPKAHEARRDAREALEAEAEPMITSLALLINPEGHYLYSRAAIRDEVRDGGVEISFRSVERMVKKARSGKGRKSS